MNANNENKLHWLCHRKHVYVSRSRVQAVKSKLPHSQGLLFLFCRLGFADFKSAIKNYLSFKGAEIFLVKILQNFNI